MAPWTGWNWNSGWNRRRNKVSEEVRENAREAILGMQKLAEVRKHQGQHEVRGDKLVIPGLKPPRSSRANRRSRGRGRRTYEVPEEQPIEFVHPVEDEVEEYAAQVDREVSGSTIGYEQEAEYKPSVDICPRRRRRQRNRWTWRRKNTADVSTEADEADRASSQGTSSQGSRPSETAAPKRSRQNRRRRPRAVEPAEASW